jgi:hypothetical protein
LRGRAGFGSGVLVLVVVEVGVRDLEGVEKQAGAAKVDVVGGDADYEGAEGLLDVAAGVGVWKREGGLAGSAVTKVFYGATGLVMVVAEALAAHSRASAAAVFRADVAAAE